MPIIDGSSQFVLWPPSDDQKRQKKKEDAGVDYMIDRY
jgi:hypothetical protein